MSGKLNLCLHAGGYEVPIERVFEIATPPEDGRFVPIPHKTVYDLVTSALANLHFTVVGEQHALAKGGQRYFAMMQIANGQAAGDEYAWVLGIRNSHDKSMPCGLVFGSGVFVCDNMAFSGEIKIARKHTTHIMRDLPTLTTNAVGMLSSKWTSMDKRFEAYKATNLSEVQVHDLTIRALDCGAIITTQVPAVVNEWRKPQQVEFSMIPKTAWRFFNACTSVSKGMNPFMLPQRTQRLHALIDSECGLVSKPEAIAAGTEDAKVEVA